MNAGSLFTGIGGLDLGVGVPPAWFCEYDPHCRTVLERHWPGVPIYPDVRELGADAPRVDVLHGGYPCQPFSVAGKREGEADPRHLWPEFARLIRVLRPRVVVAENVAGHLRLGFHAVLADLAGLGMDVRWGVVRASDVGAPHQRARLFVVATDPEQRRVDADGRVRVGDGGSGHTAGREAVPAGAEVALAADALTGGPGAPADAEHTECSRVGNESGLPRRPDGEAPADSYDGRREQRDPSVGNVRLARENGAQPAFDADVLDVRAGRRRRGTAGGADTRTDAQAADAISVRLEARENDGRPFSDASLCRTSDADADERSGLGRLQPGLGPRDNARGRSEDRHNGHGSTDWGVYADAIRRWEAVNGTAPRPTDDRGRLMPEFVEWMMGFPAGWVDGIGRTHALRMLGNAVVPQQARFALSLLSQGGPTWG